MLHFFLYEKCYKNEERQLCDTCAFTSRNSSLLPLGGHLKGFSTAVLQQQTPMAVLSCIYIFFCFTVDTHTGATKYKHSGDDWNYCERTQFPTDILQGPFSISELHVCVCVCV